MHDRSLRRSRWLGLALSLLWPGLGHVYGHFDRVGSLLLLLPVCLGLGLWWLMQVEQPTALTLAIALALLVTWLLLVLGCAVHAWHVVGRRPLVTRASPQRLIGVLLPVALVINTALAARGVVPVRWRPCRADSAAMLPTLRDGEWLLVQVGFYRAHAMQRGDMVALAWPANASRLRFRRLIGLPGDTVQRRAGRIWVNGVALAQAAIDAPPPADAPDARLDRLTLPSGRTFTVLKRTDDGPMADTPPLAVPAQSVFVIADNLDATPDSFTVPFAAVSGRAAIIVWSAEPARIATVLD
jgi:signal peptidase I